MKEGERERKLNEKAGNGVKSHYQANDLVEFIRTKPTSKNQNASVLCF